VHLNDLITRAFNDERLTADEVAYLLSLPPTSMETYRLLAASRELSAQVCSALVTQRCMPSLQLTLLPAQKTACSVPLQ
jgi:hypothetical protein